VDLSAPGYVMGMCLRASREWLPAKALPHSIYGNRCTLLERKV